MHSHSTLAGRFVVSNSWVFGVGVVLVVAGTYLHWKLGEHLMRAEEDAKDGLLSEDQARRRIALFRWAGPVMIVAGASAFGLVLWS